ncbi:hypothetical protein GIB67_031305 [Kingdonia uniflora]|uniref:Uncharacterized protein n=1 Tax=Kingdonia uniflora TaxID=39325 RepID=A0A7J7P5T3_9MAGN|nr:hypothetical protein GIB67_031305 [Kingdonia uniflora]
MIMFELKLKIVGYYDHKEGKGDTSRWFCSALSVTDAFFFFDVSNVINHLLIAFARDYLMPVLDLTNPQHKGPWGALSPVPENNAIAVDYQGGSLYVVVGDFCGYCWDVCINKSIAELISELGYLGKPIATDAGESYTWSRRLVVFLNKYTSHKEHLDGICPTEAAVNTVHAILKELVRKAISDTALSQDVEKGGNLTHSIFDRYNDSSQESS